MMAKPGQYIDAARRALAAGLCVVPVKGTTKHPDLISWTDYQDRLPTDAELILWFEQRNPPGLGYITGAVSGGLELIEIEARGMHLFPAIMAADVRGVLKRIDAGYRETSPTGGVHWLVRCPEIGPSMRLARTAGGEVVVETRGEGGFAVAAPSSGEAHTTGWPWVMNNGGHATIVTVTAEELRYVHDLLRAFDLFVAPTTRPRAATPLWATEATPGGDDEPPGAHFARVTEWAVILEAHGWVHLRTDARDISYWRRPDQPVLDKHGATVNANGTDRLYVWSTSTEFIPNDSYSKMGALAVLEYGGDYAATSRGLRALGFGGARPALMPGTADVAGPRPPSRPDVIEPTSVVEVEPEKSMLYLPWSPFWIHDHAEEDWIAYPILPAGRQVALYAPAKTGKSLLALDIAVALATNSRVLGSRLGKLDAVVAYFDYEMTEDDLYERLTDMGYGPETDLSRLHYALLPALRPLDTEDGGRELLEAAVSVGADVVVIDTTSSSVAGDESDSGTFRDFYRHTGKLLKAAGIALIRTDHAGKNLELGQRGSSAKNDDVDVVFQATKTEHGLRLRRTHSRVSWVPENIALAIEHDPLRHVISGGGDGYAEGTLEVAKAIVALGVPLDASARTAEKALREAGQGRSSKLIRDAMRYLTVPRPDAVPNDADKDGSDA